MSSVSTGKSGHGTPLGDFQILQKNRWHRSNLYSNAPMPFMQRLTWDGIAIHAGDDPGYPASHGCIRVPAAFARGLFDLTALGANVLVTDDMIGVQFYLPYEMPLWASVASEWPAGADELRPANPGTLPGRRFIGVQSAALHLDYSPSIFVE